MKARLKALPYAALCVGCQEDSERIDRIEREQIDWSTLVDPADTLQLPSPWNTRTEAIHYRRRFGPGQPLILVTSALHLPRAMMHFRRAGLDPIPAPADRITKEDEIPDGIQVLPGSGNLMLMKRALHE